MLLIADVWWAVCLNDWRCRGRVGSLSKQIGLMCLIHVATPLAIIEFYRYNGISDYVTEFPFTAQSISANWSLIGFFLHVKTPIKTPINTNWPTWNRALLFVIVVVVVIIIITIIVIIIIITIIIIIITGIGLTSVFACLHGFDGAHWLTYQYGMTYFSEVLQYNIFLVKYN